MPRFSPKRDKNEREIIDCLVACGCTVIQLDGKDIPDLGVGFNGWNFFMEVKSKGGKLSEGQQQWHENWNGTSWVVYTKDEACQHIIKFTGICNHPVWNTIGLSPSDYLYVWHHTNEAEKEFLEQNNNARDKLYEIQKRIREVIKRDFSEFKQIVEEAEKYNITILSFF